MAIYHFSAKLIGRANGSSALASAAYRSAGRLYDERLDRHHDFTNKSGVVHSEVLTPEHVPEEFHEREKLWNAVEAAEKRKDAQLAREIEFAIPRELDQAQAIELARDFVTREFVARGMIADLNVHWDRDAEGEPKPHAHVMLTTRAVDETGFGAKVREWNRTELLTHWREAWADHVNERLARLGIEARIDHRSLSDQGIELEPQHKIGPAAARMAGEGLEADRLDEHREIARENGERVIADPSIALEAITHQQATFTRRDLARFAHRHSEGLEQFNQVMAAVEGSPDLVRLGRDGRGQDRFTSKEMIAVEERLHRAADRMAERGRHGVSEASRDRALADAEARDLVLSREQEHALAHVTDGHDLGIVIGHAGAGKSAMLGVAREAWEEGGFRVRGIALSGIAAESLEAGSGIASRTIASLEHQWAQDREALSAQDVLVIDEAGMIGSRQLERVLSEAERRGAKVVLVGDPEQLQAIEAGAAFRSLSERLPHVEIGEIRRQRERWQRDATRHLATEHTAEALDAYRDHGMVHAAPTRDEARGQLIESWDRDRQKAPAKNQIILTHTNEEVRAINQLARGKMREAGELGEEVPIQVERGRREFAAGDRVMFLRNERALGVKNGSLGVIEDVNAHALKVRLDAGRSITFDLKDYAHLDHGYAATIHKAQGVTLDRVHVLATPGFDRHAAYVALSRHRDRVDLHYGRDDFADEARLARVLSRERAKDMASDYAPETEAPERGKGPAIGRAPAGLPGQPPENSRGIFASFRPVTQPGESTATPEQSPDHRPDMDRAIRRYATLTQEIERMREKSLPVLPEQRKAWERARSRLDAIAPHAARDLESAFAQDPSLINEAAAGRSQRVLRAIEAEAQIRTDPSFRADRFVADWQKLERQRLRLEWGDDRQRAQRIRESMGAMADGLKRDPQLESILRNRRIELGLHVAKGQGLARELMDYLGLGRGRGLGR
jgi:Ti-type conjugative transfer relaxase TraA